MVVYIVKDRLPYEYDDISKVFDTMEKAVKYTEINKTRNEPYSHFYIEEWEVE